MPTAPPIGTPSIKAFPDAVKRLATLVNTYNPPEMRSLRIDVLKEMVRNPNNSPS